MYAQMFETLGSHILIIMGSYDIGTFIMEYEWAYRLLNLLMWNTKHTRVSLVYKEHLGSHLRYALITHILY